MTDISKIEEYYRDFPEWNRLDTPAGKLEFDLSMRHLKRYLEPGCEILDLGGGPGRYTIALAEKGYRVFLAELSPDLVKIAQEKIKHVDHKSRILGIEVVSALDLGIFDNEKFDSVVCFGPFYHLTNENEQRAAAREIFRVLKPNGKLFASFIPRWSGLSNLIWRGAHQPGQITPASFRKAFETGVFENQSGKGFQEGFFFRTEDIVRLFESIGFHTIETVSVQGLAN